MAVPFLDHISVQVNDSMVLILVEIAFAVLSAWAVYTDLSRGIISNRVIILFLLLGLGWQSYRGVQGSQTWAGVLFVASASLALGVTLFLLRYWAAGDGKFFTALCLGLPVNSTPQESLSLTLQVFSWTLVLGALFTVLQYRRLIWQELRRRIQALREAWRQPGGTTLSGLAGSVLLLLVRLLALMGASQGIRALVHVDMGILQTLLLGLALNWLTRHLRPRFRWGLLLALVAVQVAFLSRTPAISWLLVATALCASLVGRWVMDFGTHTLQRRVRLIDVQAGQFLADAIRLRPNGSVSFIRPKQGQLAGIGEGDRVVGPEEGALSPQQVAWIRSLVEQGLVPPSATVALESSMPYAPFLVLGAVAATLGTLLPHLLDR